jgi:hypothetical protein
MRKEDNDSQPFEEIVDEHGRRYTSGADLVRPDQEQKTHHFPTALLIWLDVVLILGGIILLRIMDQRSMRQPVVDVVSALNGKDINRLRACFTADGTIGTAESLLPAAAILSAFEPYIGQYGGEGDLKFYKLEKVQKMAGGKYQADFSVVYHLAGIGDESSPLGRVPIYKNGHVVLKRLGWFRWKIASLTSEEPELSEAIAVAVQGKAMSDLLKQFSPGGH